MEDKDFVQCFNSFVISYFYDSFTLRSFEVIGDTLQTIYLQFNQTASYDFFAVV
jgi:hypothetical protein